MNIDAVVVANYLFRIPGDTFSALEAVLSWRNYGSCKTAKKLATYINTLPPEVLSACQRILEIET
jgi:hypothetical protein